MSGKPGKKGFKVSTFYHHGMQYRQGESVLVNPDSPNSPPFIGRIKEIVKLSQTDDDDIELTLAWFYRPEEAVGGRKAFHGDKEVFLSDHLDVVHKNTVIGKCRVHSLKAYEALAQVTDQDFYSRFKYHPATKEFVPDKVPVYCVCEQPYNPDRKMVLCDRCSEWYHLECVGETQANVDAKSSYFCRSCCLADSNNDLGNGPNKRQRIEGGECDAVAPLDYSQPPFLNTQITTGRS